MSESLDMHDLCSPHVQRKWLLVGLEEDMRGTGTGQRKWCSGGRNGTSLRLFLLLQSVCIQVVGPGSGYDSGTMPAPALTASSGRVMDRVKASLDQGLFQEEEVHFSDIENDILILAWQGYSLSCTVCSSTETSCTGPSITCPDNNICVSSYAVTAAGGIETKIFTRNCEPQTRCGINGSITLPTYKLPANNNIKNGVTCRTCISADSDYCYTSDTVECTGDEKMCLLQSTKISGSISSKVALRGCATESICNIGSQSASGNGLTTEVITKCSNGNIGLYQGFFFPAAALLLMKLLS
ncbi:LOW QUALITY PROTEIN: uncharacterized protein LOC142498161 [Ascaphus truei]|uniref:LOW QUALITY PROTEIN: uncharacterized protein LOC142498161 n=1 Tax=Ascaphus truei TaxID=8439 RepID=UPI003F594F54